MRKPERRSRPFPAAVTVGWVLLVTILTLAVVALLVTRAVLVALAAPGRARGGAVAQVR